MAKSVAIGKRLKIDKAKQNMLLAVAGASFILGISLVFAVYFLRYIRFNSTVISEKDKAIQGYSDAIRDIGICRRPSGKVYNGSELNSCDPNDPDTLNKVEKDSLRYEIVTNVSQNKSLEDVGRTGLSVCYDTSTGKRLSFDSLLQRYRYAATDEAAANYLNMIGMCSALRVIPDALPSTANQLALGASLNKIFQISRYEPEGITPGEAEESDLPGIGGIGINLQVESNAETTMRVLGNLEKSIREISIRTARIEQSNNSLKLDASATAYYTEPAMINEKIETVFGDGRVVKNDDEGGL
ncbi:hypothetical protein IKF74_02755 [Candidatus Saccharibacteria bacterium]|nr:hypothetical protein [Candidatus Saccharibacteria bacterium]